MYFGEGFEEKKKVLIADDDAINRRVLRRILSREYEVAEASNGQEALELLHADPSIAAVLLDVHMPLMDGYEMLDVIRRDEKLYQMPVLAMTAADVNTAKERVLRAGADDFLIKPVAPSVMLRRLETAILLQNLPDQGAAKILDALPCRVWLFDAATGKRLYANRQAAALDAMNPSETSEQAETPGMSVTPVTSETSETPVTSETSGMSETPVTSGMSVMSGMSETPVTSETPAMSGTSVTSVTSVTSGTPAMSETEALKSFDSLMESDLGLSSTVTDMEWKGRRAKLVTSRDGLSMK